MADPGSTSTSKGKQKVTFAEDTLSGDEDTNAEPKKLKAEEETSRPSGGKIGQLEIYRSGLVKMKLGNGIAMEVRSQLALEMRLLAYLVLKGDCRHPTFILATRRLP
jgi:hypothetical protein